MQIGVEGLQTFLFEIVGNKGTSVFHELSYVSGFTTWSCRHIKDTFTGLGRKGSYGEERAGTLKDIVPC